MQYVYLYILDRGCCIMQTWQYVLSEMMAVVAIVTSCIVQTWQYVSNGACWAGLARPGSINI